MPLHESFGSAHSVRLSRLSTIPTNDDLKYLLDEVKKHRKKAVELPFNHNQTDFTIKAMLVGPQNTPRWTLQRGEGASSKILWTKDSDDVMMIQSRIKKESVPASSPTETPAVNSSVKVGQVLERERFTGLPENQIREAPKLLLPPKPLPLSGFRKELATSEEWTYGSKEEAKTPGDSAMNDDLAQVRSFARKTVSDLIIPALDFDQNVEKSGAEQASEDAVTGGAGEEPDAAEKRSFDSVVNIPLPPPVVFDKSLVENVSNKLIDKHTSLMSFGALVFFLMKEFDRFERKGTGFALVICEIAFKLDDRFIGVSYDALPAVAARIQSVCAPHHVAAHVAGSEFAILLDDSEDDVIINFSETLYNAIRAQPSLVSAIPDDSVRVAIGVASIPNTCTDPGVLVSTAEMAKEMAKGKSPSYLLFPASTDN